MLERTGKDVGSTRKVYADEQGFVFCSIQAKPLSPAAEAFRYFILNEGEALLARQFGKSVPLKSADRSSPRRRGPRLEHS